VDRHRSSSPGDNDRNAICGGDGRRYSRHFDLQGIDFSTVPGPRKRPSLRVNLPCPGFGDFRSDQSAAGELTSARCAATEEVDSPRTAFESPCRDASGDLRSFTMTVQTGPRSHARIVGWPVGRWDRVAMPPVAAPDGLEPAGCRTDGLTAGGR